MIFKPNKRLLSEGLYIFKHIPRKRFSITQLTTATALFISWSYFYSVHQKKIFMQKLKDRDEDLNDKIMNFSSDLKIQQNEDEQLLIDYLSNTPFNIQFIKQMIQEQQQFFNIKSGSNEKKGEQHNFVVIIKGGEDIYQFFKVYKDLEQLLKQYNLPFLAIYDQSILEENVKNIIDFQASQAILAYPEQSQSYLLTNLEPNTVYCLDIDNNKCIFQQELSGINQKLSSKLQIRINKEIEKLFVSQFKF